MIYTFATNLEEERAYFFIALKPFLWLLLSILGDHQLIELVLSPP